MIVWFSWIISICEIYGEYRTEGHNSVLKTVTGSRAEKSSKGHKTIGFVFWAQRKPIAILEIYKAF